MAIMLGGSIGRALVGLGKVVAPTTRHLHAMPPPGALEGVVQRAVERVRRDGEEGEGGADLALTLGREEVVAEVGRELEVAWPSEQWRVEHFR